MPSVHLEDLRLVADVPNTDAKLTLQTEYVQLLVFAVVLEAANLVRESSPKAFREKIETISKGHLPRAIANVAAVLVRGALDGCTALAPGRRSYASRMLPTSSNVALEAINLGVVGCAEAENGYDVAFIRPDGSTTVVTIPLPFHLIADIVSAVLLLAARVLAAASDAHAQKSLRRLAMGIPEGEFCDVVAIALIAALDASAQVSAAQKGIFISSPIVQQLLERSA